MKTKFTHALFISMALVFSFGQSKAQTKVIEYWNFNQTQPIGGAGGIHFSSLPADYSTLSGAKVVYTSMGKIVVPADTGYMDNLAGDTINERVGFGFDTLNAKIQSGVRTRNPSDSMEFLWYIPTNTYKNIMISYETEKSGSGMNEETYSYSLDGGTTFITTGLPMAYDSAQGGWTKVSLNLSAITTVNNNPNLVFRITYDNPSLALCNCTASNGNDRYDNIVVEGDTLPAGINEIRAGSGSYNMYPNPASDYTTITGANNGPKIVTLYNIVGQAISITNEADKQFNVNTAALNPGIYFVNIKEVRTGNAYVLKLVKN